MGARIHQSAGAPGHWHVQEPRSVAGLDRYETIGLPAAGSTAGSSLTLTLPVRKPLSTVTVPEVANHSDCFEWKTVTQTPSPQEALLSTVAPVFLTLTATCQPLPPFVPFSAALDQMRLRKTPGMSGTVCWLHCADETARVPERAPVKVSEPFAEASAAAPPTRAPPLRRRSTWR